MRFFQIAFLSSLILFSVGCSKEPFPENDPPGSSTPVFSVSGTVGEDDIVMNSGQDGLYLFTWSEEIGDDLWELHCAIRDSECEDCGPELHFSWFCEASDGELETTLSIGEHDFFSGFGTDEVFFDTEAPNESIWLINDSFVAIADQGFTLDALEAYGGFDLRIENTSECFSAFEYSDVWYDPCEEFNLPTLDWEIEDDEIYIYPTDELQTVGGWWFSDQGIEETEPGEPLVLDLPEFMDAMAVSYVPIPADDQFFNFYEISAFIDLSEDCEPLEFSIETEETFPGNGLLVEYQNDEGNVFVSQELCGYWGFPFEQPSTSTFEILSSEAFVENEEGVPTKKFEIRVDCLLADFEDVSPELFQLEIEGTVAFAFPY